MALGIGGFSSSYNWWNTTGRVSPNPGGTLSTSNQILEQSPETAFYRWTRNMGVQDDNSGFSKWMRQQFPNYQLGYQAHTVDNPLSANIVDYTNSLSGNYDDWMRRYMMQSPQQRGLDPGARGGGPARWIGR